MPTTYDLDLLLDQGDEVYQLALTAGTYDVEQFLDNVVLQEGPQGNETFDETINDAISRVQSAHPVHPRLLDESRPDRTRQYDTGPLIAAYNSMLSANRAAGHQLAFDTLIEWANEQDTYDDIEDMEEDDFDPDATLSHLRGVRVAVVRTAHKFGIAIQEMPAAIDDPRL